jgi:hypothetical protein
MQDNGNEFLFRKITKKLDKKNPATKDCGILLLFYSIYF